MHGQKETSWCARCSFSAVWTHLAHITRFCLPLLLTSLRNFEALSINVKVTSP